jgi:rhamnogalacturonyl hydrolase YesR
LKKAIAQDLPGIIAKLRERALAGNTPAAIALMRTILAPAKESTPPINFDLPEVSSPALAVEAMTAVVAGLASGALEPEQARALTAALDGLVKALETHDTAARLAALEARIQEKSR